MRRSLFWWGLFLVALILTQLCPALAQELDKETYPLEKRLFVLAKAYAAIGVYFAHTQDVSNLNPDELYKEYLAKAISTGDRYEFDLLMMEFVGRLHNGHSWFRDAWLRRTRNQSLGFEFRYIQDQWVVTASKDSRVRPGDVLQKINGETFEAFYLKNKKYTNLASERSSRVSFSTFRFLFPRQFALGLASGKTIPITRSEPAIVEPVVTGHWISNGKVAFLRLVHLDGSDIEKQALEHVATFQSAEFLIIDLRGYAGGITPEKLVDALMDRPYRSWTEATNVNIGLFKFYAEQYEKFSGSPAAEQLQPFAAYFRHSMLFWPSQYQQPQRTLFHGKIILLVDAGCMSAKEDFIVPFKDNKRATLIGEKTAGTSGQPYFYNFDSDLNLAIGAKREFFPDGSPFEGVGIEPDIELLPTVEDVRKGRDPVLDRAIAMAQGQ